MALVEIDTNEISVLGEETPAVNLTSAAAEKIRGLLEERSLPNHGLRVFVSGGGCSGMNYGMALEAEAREFDTIVEQDGVKLFVDPTSLSYLVGSTVDYVGDLMGGGFRIDNPNAVSTCGCGHSFRTEGGAAPAAGGGCAC
ncbi:MAG: iron-sulfur cluster insertion protein ErpA [Anaerolineales bacterium]